MGTGTKWLLNIGLAALVLTGTVIATPDVSGAQGAGNVVADSGFRPDTNGFSFENYGNDVTGGVTNLTAAEMEELYGPAVCSSVAADGTCTLTPVADGWMKDQNTGMNGGHCYGMSVAALLFFKNQLSVSDYGGGSVSAMTIHGNTGLQQRIAQSFVYQELGSVQAGQIKGTPTEVLNALISKLKDAGPESWGIGFYKLDHSGGHEVTPFEVVDDGDGQFGIGIYDNNYPKEIRTIKVDTKADTWTYDGAANPKEPIDHYIGNAQSKTLELDPTTPGNAVQPCPFCATQPSGSAVTSAVTKTMATSSAGLSQFRLEASPRKHGHLLFTDAQGRQTGYRNGTFVNQIQGARVIFPRLNIDFGESEEPTYFLPATDALRITLDGTNLTSASDSNLIETGPSYTASVNNIHLQPGERDQFVVSADIPQISYRPGASQSPAIQLAVDEPQTDYSVFVQAHKMRSGTRLGFQLKLAALTIDASGVAAPSRYEATLIKQDANGAQPPLARALTIQAHQTATYPFASWLF